MTSLERSRARVFSSLAASRRSGQFADSGGFRILAHALRRQRRVRLFPTFHRGFAGGAPLPASTAACGELRPLSFHYLADLVGDDDHSGCSLCRSAGMITTFAADNPRLIGTALRHCPPLGRGGEPPDFAGHAAERSPWIDGSVTRCRRPHHPLRHASTRAPS